jgi:hypothetical protein
VAPLDAAPQHPSLIDKPSAIRAHDPWRISTPTALILAVVIFALAGLAAMGLVALLRGAP